jgi:hypothetical protein
MFGRGAGQLAARQPHNPELMYTSVGQLAAGMVVDAIIKRELRRSPDGHVRPEARLQAIWTGAVLVPVSTLYTTDLLYLTDVASCGKGGFAHIRVMHCKCRCALVWRADGYGYCVLRHAGYHGAIVSCLSLLVTGVI